MKRIHYGWYVCAAATLMLFTCMGIVANGFAVLMPMIRNEYGLTNAQTSSLVTLRNLITFFGMWMTTVYYDKIGIRKGCGFAVLLGSAAFIIYSFSDKYIMFCIGSAVSGFSYAFGTMIPAAILMNRWFVKHKALALGICGAGSGVAMIVIPPVVTFLAEAVSLSFAFRAFAIFMFIVAIIVVLIVKSDPSELGLKRYGEDEIAAEAFAEAFGNAPVADTSGKALPTSLYVVLIAACMLTGAVASVGYAHLSILFSDAGFEAMYIASMISIIGILLTLGKLTFGYFTDRFGGYWTSMAFWTLVIIGHVACCMAYSQSKLISVIVAVTLGSGYALTNLGASIWANDMVKQEHYAKVIRTLNVSSSGGALLISTVPGILADISGNYISSYVMFTIFSIVATTLTLTAYKMNKKAC